MLLPGGALGSKSVGGVDVPRKIQADCVFCKILDGVLPVSSIYADETCIGFLATEPVNAGHALVIPRAHLSYLDEVPPKVAGHIFRIGQELAAAIRRSGLPCDGVNIFVADGAAAGQEVSHFHLHVYPRIKDDGFGFKYDHRHFQQPPREELDRIANMIRPQMNQKVERAVD